MGSSNSAEREGKLTSELAIEALGAADGMLANEWSNADDFLSTSEVTAALKKSGVESCNLVVGIDGTKSNLQQGKDSFGGLSLHDGSQGPSPYEQALTSVMTGQLFS
jgi:hypothetical protein